MLYRMQQSDTEIVETTRRLHVIKNATRTGAVIPFPYGTSLCQLQTSIARRLEMEYVAYLFNPHGCEITDISLVRDDDVIIASAKEKFQKPGVKKPAETAMKTMLKEFFKFLLKTSIGIMKKYVTEALTA